MGQPITNPADFVVDKRKIKIQCSLMGDAYGKDHKTALNRQYSSDS